MKLILNNEQIEFIEQDIFITNVPLDAIFNDTKVITEINGELNGELNSLLQIVEQHPGIQAKNLPAILQNKPLKTLQKQLQRLVDLKYIERRGSKKTGGYYLITN